MHESEILVIGGGIAGAVTALKAAGAGADVILIQRGADGQGQNTYWAQGGIIYRGKQDSAELLTRDIMDAGAGLSYEPAARALAEEGPRLIDEILVKKAGIQFDRTRMSDGSEGEYDITEEAAHSVPRILHCEDRTGYFISKALEAAVEAEPRIRVLRNHAAIELLTRSHHSLNPLDRYAPPSCFGVYALDRETGEVGIIKARETVLATGGLGQLFLHSTNPKKARGDGIAMVWRARGRLLNLEYVQFHPTALYHAHAPRYLISESLRGEGGKLVLSNGAEFMQKYDPRGSLAPRDVVARAIHAELLASGEPCVYLDLTHKPAEWVRGRFPGIDKTCRKYGIDIANQPIPVVPAAHYHCGGVATDLHGRTSIPNLWAVGEVACTGLHGANRLASTSLLEGLVFGARAAEALVANLRANAYPPMPEVADWVMEKNPPDPALILQDWMTIKYTMWNYVGLARTEKRLLRAKHILMALREEIEEFYATARLDEEMIGLRNGVQVALAILFSALNNRRSRGCHYRLDENQPDASM